MLGTSLIPRHSRAGRSGFRHTAAGVFRSKVQVLEDVLWSLPWPGLDPAIHFLLLDPATLDELK
jgi:hypothetical protein